MDRLKLNDAELRRRLEDSQAALHELGRENQVLQVLYQSRMTHFLFIIKKTNVFLPSLQMENAKLQGRRWVDDSEVNGCLPKKF